MQVRFAYTRSIVALCLTLSTQVGRAQSEKLPTGSDDPLPVNSVWVNESLNLTFTVLEREGESFRAKLVVGNGIDRTIKGTVKGNRVTWFSQDVKATKGDQGGDNDGVVNGDQIDFTFTARKGTGKFTLRRRHTRQSSSTSSNRSASVPTLDDRSFERWRDFIRPHPEDLEWMKIGWQANLAKAVIEAQQKDKPILIFAMNGNPCGFV